VFCCKLTYLSLCFIVELKLSSNLILYKMSLGEDEWDMNVLYFATMKIMGREFNISLSY